MLPGLWAAVKCSELLCGGMQGTKAPEEWKKTRRAAEGELCGQPAAQWRVGPGACGLKICLRYGWRLGDLGLVGGEPRCSMEAVVLLLTVTAHGCQGLLRPAGQWQWSCSACLQCGHQETVSWRASPTMVSSGYSGFRVKGTLL